MKQHVVPVVFGPDGARYLEMTDPGAHLERKFTYPERRYREFVSGSGRKANAYLRGSKARIARSMLAGEDAELLVEEKAETAAETAAREARELRDSTFDADERGLAALLFWNRAMDSLMGREPAEGVSMVDAVARLGGRVLLEKIRHFRMAALDVAWTGWAANGVGTAHWR